MNCAVARTFRNIVYTVHVCRSFVWWFQTLSHTHTRCRLFHNREDETMVLVCLKWLMLRGFRQSATMLVPNSFFPVHQKSICENVQFRSNGFTLIQGSTWEHWPLNLLTRKPHLRNDDGRCAVCGLRHLCGWHHYHTICWSMTRTLVFCSPKNWPLNSQNWLKTLYTIVLCVLRPRFRSPTRQQPTISLLYKTKYDSKYVFWRSITIGPRYVYYLLLSAIKSKKIRFNLFAVTIWAIRFDPQNKHKNT